MSHIVDKIKNEKLCGQYLENFIAALKSKLARDAASHKNKTNIPYGNGEELVVKKTEVESDIIPGKKEEKPEYILTDPSQYQDKIIRYLVSNLPRFIEKGVNYDTIISNIRKTQEFAGVNLQELYDDGGFEQSVNQIKGLRQLEPKQLGAIQVFANSLNSISPVFFRHLASQEGVFDELFTEKFVEEFQNFSSQGDRDLRQMYSQAQSMPFAVEPFMYNYLNWKAFENQDKDVYPCRNMREKLDVYQQLTERFGNQDIHKEAIALALENRFVKSDDILGTGGSPEEILQRIKDGEKLSIDVEAFERHYKSYVFGKIGHAKQEQYDRAWSLAEERVFEDYPFIKEALGQSLAK